MEKGARQRTWVWRSLGTIAQLLPTWLWLVFGQFHEQGVGGLTIDPAEGARLYALAAAHGLSDAQWRLGFCYEYGEGVLKDVMEARRLYQLAAEKGDANAEAILGHSYMTGSCGPRDFSLAMHWSRRAAEKGSGLAENSIGRMFFEGLGVPRVRGAA